MKNASQTYLLNLTTQEFESITLAIMLNSNKIGKLQGLGRCINHWLRQWDAGELAIINPGSSQQLERQPEQNHQIYVGLTGDTATLFRTWRAALAKISAMPVTVTMAVMTLIYCAIAQHGGKFA